MGLRGGVHSSGLVILEYCNCYIRIFVIGIFSFITCTCHLPSVYKVYFVFVSSVSQRLQRAFEFCNENRAVKN